MYNFYVYAYVRYDGTPYYIGKGKGDRAYSPIHKVPRPKEKNRIIILEQHLSEIGAFALERRYIKWFGRKDNNTGILRNMTDGGEGTAGAIISQKHRDSVAAANKTRIITDETRAKLSASLKGKTRTDESRAKMSAAQKAYCQKGLHNFRGRKHTPETIAKIKASKSNISEDTRKKMSEAARNRTEEHKAKLAAANRTPERIAQTIAIHKGRKHTPEAKAKMSVAAKNRFINKNKEKPLCNF